MTEERLRDLLHESVSETVGPDLAEVAWRRARGRRRRQRAVTLGAVVVVVATGITGVRLLTPGDPADRIGPAKHSAEPTPTPPTSTPPDVRPDASYLGVPVWWAPADPAALAATAAGTGVLPASIDLAGAQPDAVAHPLARAVAALSDTASVAAPDGPVRLVGADGRERDLDVSQLDGLAADGGARVSPVDRSMLSPDGKTLAFPQDDHLMLFDIPAGEWRRLDVPAASGVRWADGSTLFVPSAQGSGGRLVALDGTGEGRANLSDVVRPGVDLGAVSLVGPWRAASGGSVAQTYDGRRGTVPGRSDADQTYVVIRDASGTRILVLGPTDDAPGWWLLADWLDADTLVYESVDEGRADLVSWRVGTHDFALVSTVTGLASTGHRFIGSYALQG